jgi:hypothetical protein
MSATPGNTTPRWLAWAGTPGRDVYHWCLNLPRFIALVPEAGQRTLDVGCGEDAAAGG